MPNSWKQFFLDSKQGKIFDKGSQKSSTMDVYSWIFLDYNIHTIRIRVYIFTDTYTLKWYGSFSTALAGTLTFRSISYFVYPNIG